MRPLALALLVVLAAHLCAQAAEGEDAVLQKARDLVERKAYGEALMQYESIGKWLERDPGLLIEWARVYAYTNRHDEAIALFERVRTAHPAQAGAIAQELEEQRIYRDINRARVLVEKRRYAEALVLYEKRAAWLERDPGLLIEWARVYAYADRNPEALDLFERVSKQHPAQAAAIAKELSEQRTFVALQKARMLVEKEKYAEAIAVYGSVRAVLDTDPGLLIELARVYSYADQHKEAIALFEQVREKHPQQTPIFVRELGDMYTWNRQLDKAVETYREGIRGNPEDVASHLGLARALGWMGLHRDALREYDVILKRQPDSIEAMIGKADTLSWLDDLEDAWEMLEDVRKIDPANKDAMNLRGRILVWNGFHRDGADMYRQVIGKFTNNLDAKEGLAFALHWDGRDAEAADIVREILLASPFRAETTKLNHELRDVRQPILRADLEFLDDSNDRQILHYGLSGGKLLTHSLRLAGFYQWMFMEELDGDGVTEREYRVDRPGLDAQWRASESLMFGGRIGRIYNFETDWAAMTGDGRMDWMPDDRWVLRAGYERDYLRGGAAIENKLLVRGWYGGASYRHDRRWQAAVTGSDSEYSDGNERESVLCSLEHRFRSRPYGKLYYNHQWSRWDRPSPDYFSVDRFRAHTVGLYCSWTAAKRWMVEGQGSLGYEIQERGDRLHLWNWFAAGGFRYRPSPKWSLGGRVERFESHEIDGVPEDEYSRTRYMLTLTYAFGGRSEDGEPAQASVPDPGDR